MDRMIVSPLKYMAFFAIFAVCLFTLAGARECRAGLVEYQPHPWSDESLRIVRDGQVLSSSSPSTIQDFAQDMNYTYSQDTFLDVAIAHTGYAVSNPSENSEPHMYQHVYAYTLPEGVSVSYQAENTAGHQMYYQSDSSLQTMENGNAKLPKYFKMTGNLDLNGSLLLAKSDLQGENGYKGLLASFQVVVNKLTPDEDGGFKTRKILKGTIELVGKNNGDVKIRTKGAIKKSHITSITETENLFQIDFVDKAIPYALKTKRGEEYILDTTITGLVNIQGSGTGAEIMFTPGSLAVPSIQQTGYLPIYDDEPGDDNEVPEPTAFLLFLSGMGILRRLRNSRLGSADIR